MNNKPDFPTNEPATDSEKNGPIDRVWAAIARINDRLIALERPKRMAVSKIRVLVADDELLLSRLLERMLQDEGMLVYRAASGSEALSLLAQHSIDVVVTDILMPGNGNTVAKHVQDHYPACGVVLMTGGSAADAAREALGSEQVSLLLKPFEADELVLKVFRSAEYARARARLERGSGRP